MDEAGVIAGFYLLDRGPGGKLTVGGLRGCGVADKRDATRRLLAVQVPDGVAPRARILSGQFAAPVPNTVMPLDHGPGRDEAGQEGYFILCPALPGPALDAAPARWSDAEVINGLLLPAAAALEMLYDRGLTHRAIRPNNVFRAGPGEKVVLGPFWAAPPGGLQPAAYEPPYSAICLPAGRGEGSIADDVYALGVTMLWCLLGGQVPWPDGLGVISAKLEQGSLAALTGTARLGGSMTDLLRVMLAEDPDHRPLPSLLLDPAQARSRRLATRPAQRAQRALLVGQHEAWSTRELTFAMAREPDRAAALVKTGAVDRWLRRMLNDGQAAVRLEDVIHAHQDDDVAEDARTEPLLVMRAIAVLDPLAPLAWRGVALFPDGLGAALAAATHGPAASAPVAAALEELVAFDIIGQWPGCLARRRDAEGLRQFSRDVRSMLGTRGPAGGLKRVVYSLNPLLACASKLLGGRIAARAGDLLPALEAASASADRKRPPLDGHLAAFIASTADTPVMSELGATDAMTSAKERMAVLGLYGRLQLRLHPAPLPGLAGWLLECGLIELTSWQSFRARKDMAEKLAAEAKAGQIAAMVLLLRNDAAVQADRAGAEQAALRLQAITIELGQLRYGTTHRDEVARRNGQEIAAAAGLTSAMGAALVLALTG
jgi:hypothetical protein